jgi:hypothetical protein
MAVPSSPGFPEYSGTFIPEVWSTKVNYKLYPKTMLPQITNNDWEADIRDKGDKAIIRSKPTITVRDYEKGQDLIYETPESENIELIVDKAHYWASRADDIDKKQWDIEWINQWTDDAAQQVKIKMETTVFGSIYADADSRNSGATAGTNGEFNLGTAGSPVSVDSTNIIEYITACSACLDMRNVPDAGRWIILPPTLRYLVVNSDLKNANMTGDSKSPLRNGLVGEIKKLILH